MDEEKQGFVKNKSKKLQLTIDEMVEKYVGSFGFSQLQQVFFVSLARIFDSQSTLVTIFTDAQPHAWRCIGGDCGGDWSSISSGSVCDLKPGNSSWEWSGGNSTSTVAEWGLVCDQRFLAALPASVYFLGSLLGSAFFGHMADAFLGRKRSVLLSCLLTSATAFLTSLSPDIWIYSTLRFLTGFSRAGIGICSLVLSTEAVGREWRGQVGQYGFFFFAAGFLSIPLIAYPTRNCWRDLYRIISLLPLLYSVFIFAPFVSESPRWLLVRGRTEEAFQVLNRYARINGRELPSNLSLLEPCSIGSVKGDDRNKLWNTEWAMRRVALVMITGFGVGFVYYGIQLNDENLNFNLYYTVAINAMMEIPAVFIGSVFLTVANRRVLFSCSSLVAGICCLLCIVFSGNGKGPSLKRGSLAQLAMEAIGFMASSTAFDVLYIQCVELFPSNVRNVAVSMLRQALILGASIAPLLVVYGRLSPSISFATFGALSLASGLASLWLPETKNAPLYETLEQQEEEERRERLGCEMSKEMEMCIVD